MPHGHAGLNVTTGTAETEEPGESVNRVMNEPRGLQSEQVKKYDDSPVCVPSLDPPDPCAALYS